ncbi:TPT-domain-containing protein [Hortaea werneckii]|uniref:Sugar phosphate transporter domain-containing protein n=1 Tax=Hortaea werneckii TaxID=91943 RepID=A0A3M7EPC0_HORWE|nr:TPT-domain-containing protein [Hortaea werneckii]KAI6863219.1 TPT-domain-containing protein [Hortaea werneckii]KAI7349642.1 TPT-domain-containing protein [Hortaea werneckii]KAI7599701.1 TPT-domain-containing protein [Hortaea werneckii]KAI7608482.1 TPT-domain-containing protein [Hortaea werneckii]
MALPATGGLEQRRRSSSTANANGNYKFPDVSHEFMNTPFDEDELQDISRGPSPKPLPNGLPHGLHSSERWPAKKNARAMQWSSWANGSAKGGRHGRQKSLSEAIQTVRSRRMSVSENAHEIADSLKAPVSLKLILLCGLWYATSILTNTSSKAILTALRRPVTLTVIQFLLVYLWCMILSWLAKHNASLRENVPVLKNGIRRPSKEILMATLPLTGFMIGGHILSSDAMSRIPVSLVHTIKGLSPLMTVLAYRAFFNIRYSTPIYLSLVPLTIGVGLACSASFGGEITGLLTAFGSAILFVTQNIVSKKIFNEAAKAEADGMPIGRRKPDKLNLLCYSSATAFVITLPIWFWSEGISMAKDYFDDGTLTLREKPGSLDHGRLALEFLFNGTFHFGQSLVAFVLLGMVSPVTYSVASLIKRVAVIIFAIVWFGNPMTKLQGFGFALTFLGLYLYDRTSDAAKADKKARERAQNGEPLLPLNAVDVKNKRDDGPAVYSPSPLDSENVHRPFAGGNSYSNGEMTGRPRGSSGATPPALNAMSGSLPPGTKAEETWKQGDHDVSLQQGVGVR